MPLWKQYSSVPRETEEVVVTETHAYLVSGPLREWASISLPHNTNPVTPFGTSLSLQLIIALHWKEGGVGGAQAFYNKETS